MLFRRRAHDSFILLGMLFLLCSASANASRDEALDVYKKRGEKRATGTPCLELNEKQVMSLTPKDLKGQTFDGEQARRQLSSTTHQNLEKAPGKLDPSIALIIENTETALQSKTGNIFQENQPQETIEKCLVERVLIPVTINHTLTVKVIQKPEVSCKIRSCQGHRDTKKSRDPNHTKRKKEKELKEDPTIKSYSVFIEENGIGHRDVVISQYTHVDNTLDCKNFKENTSITPGKPEELDTWHAEKQTLTDGLECSLVNEIKGPAETRIIDGRPVNRPFWTKTQNMQCFQNRQNNCAFMQNNVCIQTYEECIKYSEGKCMVWEKTFKCRPKDPHKIAQDFKGYGKDPQLWEKSHKPNSAFSDVATKLAVFDEMKKELQDSNSEDVRVVSLFKGIKQQCSKSVLKDVMYDCCFEMDGFATKIKLSKCTSDEIVLAESRRKGLTHLIGIKKEEFLGLWESRKEHVFCVFPTKLSRVFQEEARKQLGIEWGSADHPDCRGLTQEEIKKLDFTKLNLVEAFELPPEIDQGERIQRIEDRLKQRIEKM